MTGNKTAPTSSNPRRTVDRHQRPRNLERSTRVYHCSGNTIESSRPDTPVSQRSDTALRADGVSGNSRYSSPLLGPPTMLAQRSITSTLAPIEEEHDHTRLEQSRFRAMRESTEFQLQQTLKPGRLGRRNANAPKTGRPPKRTRLLNDPNTCGREDGTQSLELVSPDGGAHPLEIPPGPFKYQVALPEGLYYPVRDLSFRQDQESGNVIITVIWDDLSLPLRCFYVADTWEGLQRWVLRHLGEEYGCYFDQASQIFDSDNASDDYLESHIVSTLQLSQQWGLVATWPTSEIKLELLDTEAQQSAKSYIIKHFGAEVWRAEAQRAGLEDNY